MNIYKIIETLQKFAGEPEQKPGDQVRGTEVAKVGGKEHPFKGRLVGASESVEMECDAPMTLADKLRARWEETKREKGLAEYGMTTGGMVSGKADSLSDQTSTDNTTNQAQKTAQVQQNVNKLKAAGANIPSVNQAVQSLMKDPTTDPVSQQDKNIDAGLGQEVQDVLTKGDPNAVNQLTSLIKKVKQQG